MSEVATASPIAPAEPLIDPRKTFADVNREVSAPLERPPGTLWKVFFGISCCSRSSSRPKIALPDEEGIGIWGLNHPVGWAVDITSFVSGSASGTPAP